MSLDEANTLKSQILFGSSQCSCSSCESIFCFAKRNRELNKCHCSTCRELSTCLYVTKNDDKECSNITDKEIPTCTANKTFKTPTRVKVENKNIVSIRLFKRNVIVQAKPHSELRTCDKAIKNKTKNNQTANENNDVREYSPITYIVNKMLTTYNEISIRDIIDKIKKVYKACSCKVCECIVTNEISLCKCKPCECIECKSYLREVDDDKPRQVCSYFPGNNEVKETCSGYDRKTINDSLKLQNSVCSCKPCDCELCRIYTIKIKDNGQSFVVKKAIIDESTSCKTKSGKSIEQKQSETCSCKPCQCSLCTSPFKVQNNIVVGSVEQYLQSNDCSCLPCDCNNCRQSVAPITSPHPMRETSTGMAETVTCRCDLCLNQSCRQTTDTCGCESRNSVINKPFEKDTQNIDIHRAVISKNKSKIDEIEQTCTISVLTKIIKEYKEREANKANKNNSEDTNKCLKCSSKIRCASSLCEKSHLSTHYAKEKEETKCQCSPCECKICEKFKSVENGVWKSVKFRSKCDCDLCRCIYCGGLLQSENTTEDSKDKQETLHLKRTENTSTFTSHQSMYPALLYEYVNPSSINANLQMYNNNRFRSNNLLKDTCEDCIRMVHGDKNAIGQVHSGFSDSVGSIHAVNNCREPLHNLRAAEMIHLDDSTHSIADNRLVETFVNEIMQIDGINSNIGHASPQKELSNSSDSTTWSLHEVLKNGSQLSLKNNVNKEAKTYKCEEFSIKNDHVLQNNLSRTNQNSIGKQEAEINEPCVFCGTSTLNSFSTNPKNHEEAQIIRECFAKTNLPAINRINLTKHENKKSDLEDCNNDKIEENLQNNKDLYELDECTELESYEDYFEERSILFKAKLLTSELLKMLYEFQKANKEFDTFKNKLDIDRDSNLEENRINLHPCQQLRNIPCPDFVQVLSLKNKWNNNCDTKLKENNTILEPCQEENISNSDFKYSWSKTALINKRKTQIFPCYSKTDLRNNDLNSNVKAVINYVGPIYKKRMTESDHNEFNNSDESINYLKHAEDFTEIKEPNMIECNLSERKNIDENGKTTLNTDKYNVNAINYRKIESANKIYDDKRHILIENILQHYKQDEAISK